MTEPLTPAEIAELRAVAKAAVPGPGKHVRDPNGPALQCPKCGGQHYICSTEQERKAQRFHADIFEPRSILRLLDSHEALRQRADAGVRIGMERAARICDAAWAENDKPLPEVLAAAIRLAAAAKDEVR